MDYEMTYISTLNTAQKASFPPTNFEFSPKALAKPNVEFAKSRVQLVTYEMVRHHESTVNTE